MQLLELRREGGSEKVQVYLDGTLLRDKDQFRQYCMAKNHAQADKDGLEDNLFLWELSLAALLLYEHEHGALPKKRDGATVGVCNYLIILLHLASLPPLKQARTNTHIGIHTHTHTHTHAHTHTHSHCYSFRHPPRWPGIQFKKHDGASWGMD